VRCVLTTVVCLLTCASTAVAQDLYPRNCTVEFVGKSEHRVRCTVNGQEGSAGARDNADGSVDELTFDVSPARKHQGKHWHAKRRIPKGHFPDEQPPIPTPFELQMEAALNADPLPDVAPDTTIVIDVMIVWSQQAQNRYGSFANAQAQAVAAVASKNQSLANSLVGHVQHRLVAWGLAAYVEGSNNALSWLYANANGLTNTLSPGPNNWIRTTRLASGADLVSIFTNDGACGLGYLNSVMQTAMSQSEAGCAVSNLTYAHETGHNEGMQHDPVAVCGQPTCNGDNYGHNTSAWRTAMSYGGQPRIRWFSNPDVLYNGVPTGILGSRNNARVIRDRALAVSNFLPTASRRRPSSVVRPQAAQN
jgi:hypothetical protein